MLAILPIAASLSSLTCGDVKGLYQDTGCCESDNLDMVVRPECSRPDLLMRSTGSSA